MRNIAYYCGFDDIEDEMGFVGLETGGSAIRVCFSEGNGDLGQVIRVKKPPIRNAQRWVAELRKLIDGVGDGRQIDGIGLSAGGAFSYGIPDARFGIAQPTQMVRAVTTFDGDGSWVPMSALLRREFDLDNVVVLNDGSAAAIGEATGGVAQGEQSFVVAILSTGFGQGVFRQGQLMVDPAGCGPELGHIDRLVDHRPDQHPCPFHPGALTHPEGAFSGRVIELCEGPPPGGGYSNPVKQRWVPRASYIVKAMGPLVAAIDASLVVVRGTLGVEWFDEIRPLLEQGLQKHRPGIRIESTAMDDNAGIYGALSAVQHPDLLNGPRVDWGRFHAKFTNAERLGADL